MFASHRKTAPLFLIGLCLTLAACGTSSGDSFSSASDPDNPLLPFPFDTASDLDDDVLYESVQRLVSRAKAPANSRFDYTRIDLDGDGHRDALVYMKAPYGHWCGQHGCTMFVMRAGVEDFAYVSQVKPIRPPLIVSENSTNGWHDILVRVDGRWSRTKNIALKYDGRSYPSNPERQPPIYELASVNGVKVFP